MQEKIRLILREKLVMKMVRIQTVILILFIAIFIWKFRLLPPQIPIFYSLPRSQDQLGSPFHLLLLPFFSVIIFCLNFLLALETYAKERLAAILLLIIGVATSFLFLITFIKIVFLIS